MAVLALLTASCNSGIPTGVSTPALENPTSVNAPSSTAFPPVEQNPTPTEPTPQPLAVRVNGVGITLEEFQAELSRYQKVVGRELSPEDRQLVLDDLINQTLLAQAAAKNGFSLSETALQERLDQLASQLSGKATGPRPGATLTDWLSANGYTEEIFRLGLARAVSAAWMRDQIISQVPEIAEQVHARQILLRSAAEADQTLANLQAGGNFDVLAKAADPLTAGDMGWFPRGFLYSPDLEEAAFKLEPGQYSAVIQTLAGFHILALIEKDPQHPLSPQARLVLQENTLQDWMLKERQQSQIEIISP